MNWHFQKRYHLVVIQNLLCQGLHLQQPRGMFAKVFVGLDGCIYNKS